MVRTDVWFEDGTIKKTFEEELKVEALAIIRFPLGETKIDMIINLKNRSG